MKGKDGGDDLDPIDRVFKVTSSQEIVLVASEVETSEVLIESDEGEDGGGDMAPIECSQGYFIARGSSSSVGSGNI